MNRSFRAGTTHEEFQTTYTCLRLEMHYCNCFQTSRGETKNAHNRVIMGVINGTNVTFEIDNVMVGNVMMCVYHRCDAELPKHHSHDFPI